MPLKRGGKDAVSYNIHELTEDNKKTGKERGANGKPRSRRQIIAIALNAAGQSNKSKRKKK